MPKNEKSGHPGCTIYLGAVRSWESPLTVRAGRFTVLGNGWPETSLDSFLVSKSYGCHAHSPFCSRCTPAARRSGSPRLMSFSLVPRHSIQRCLHHSSASSSGNEHMSSESASVHRDDGGGRPPGPWAQGTSKRENSTRRRQKSHIQDVKLSPTIASHRGTFYSKVILNYSDVLPLIYKLEDIEYLCTIGRILDESD